MPNTAHRKKTLRKAEARNARNRQQRSSMRTAVRKAQTGIAEGADNADELVVTATKRLDKAAKSGLIHKNKAARMKSRMAKAKNQA